MRPRQCCRSVPRSKRHVGLIRAFRSLVLSTSNWNMLKILGEIILDENGVRLRFLALMLFCREYDNVRKKKGWIVISTKALLVGVLDCIPVVLWLRNAEHQLFTLKRAPDLNTTTKQRLESIQSTAAKETDSKQNHQFLKVLSIENP
jgi:hypothetical protein